MIPDSQGFQAPTQAVSDLDTTKVHSSYLNLHLIFVENILVLYYDRYNFNSTFRAEENK